jgi:hypothetical protein
VEEDLLVVRHGLDEPEAEEQTRKLRPVLQTKLFCGNQDILGFYYFHAYLLFSIFI